MSRSRSASTGSSSSSQAQQAAVLQPEKTFSIFVKLLSGETISLPIIEGTTVTSLRHLISLRANTAPERIRLVHAGKHLTTTANENATLEDLSIAPESTIHVTLTTAQRSGPKKLRCGVADCKDAAQRIVGDCTFCKGRFCGKHRMLEDHKCIGLEDAKKESHDRNADKLNSERTMVLKGI